MCVINCVSELKSKLVFITLKQKESLNLVFIFSFPYLIKKVFEAVRYQHRLSRRRCKLSLILFLIEYTLPPLHLKLWMAKYLTPDLQGVEHVLENYFCFHCCSKLKLKRRICQPWNSMIGWQICKLCICW